MKTGIEIIAEERARQITAEGWTPEHDDQHNRKGLAIAAACYALPEEHREYSLAGNWEMISLLDLLWGHTLWDRQWWKPTPNNRIRELAKAGALCAAEIDRLQRKET